MKYKKIILSALIFAVAGYFSYQKFLVKKTETASAKSAAHSDTVRLPVNAPQLDFLKVSPAEAAPKPLVEPLNAKISYDDNKTAKIFTPIAGRVIKIVAEAGKMVQAGEALAVIDSPDYAQAVADDAKANADLLLKKKAHERAKTLFAGNVLAQKDLESAEADFQQAQAEATRAKMRLANLGPKAEAQFILRSPISGIVSERQVNVGSEIRPDAPNPLFVVTDPMHYWVLVDLSERDFGKVKIGQNAIVEVDAYPGEKFPAKISVIGEMLDPVTRRVQVRCILDNGKKMLKPEMFARVTPIADEKATLPRVPNSAIITSGLKSYIFVENSAGVFQKRAVKFAQQGQEFSYVNEGLNAGEKVVTAGALLLNSELGE